MEEENSELLVCPSFNSYSSDRFADTADQVTREFGGGRERHRQVCDDYQGEELEYNDDDFEFVSVSKSDDVVFLDGQIGPVFPIFNRDLLSEKSQRQTNDARDPKAAEGRGVLSLRVPLKKLFVEERDPTFSTSSEEEVEGELDGVPPGTYCIWTPNNSSNNNSAQASPSKCKKSSSTGTRSSSASKRWRLLSLLRRCNSEGKDSVVFLTPKKEEFKAEKAEQVESKEKKVKKAARETMSSAHEVFYVRNRAIKEADKRRTYLPYRQDLVGFWSSVGALGKTFPPF